MSKRYLNFETECDTCNMVTWHREDLTQTPERVVSVFGDYDLVWAECGQCGISVQYLGTNASV